MKLTTYESSDIKKNPEEHQSANLLNERIMMSLRFRIMRHKWEGHAVWGRLESSHMGISELYLWKAARNMKGCAFGKMMEERW